MGGGGGAEFQIYLLPRVLREAVRRGWGTPGGRPMVVLMCPSWFAFLRVAEAASFGGERPSGFGGINGRFR